MQKKGTLLFVLLALTPLTTAVQKRSDDVDMNAVMTSVQRQAATVETLQAELSSLQSTVQQQANVIADLSHRLDQTNSSVNLLGGRLDMKVAFMAHVAGFEFTMGTDSPVKFDAIVTNVGGSYSGHSGVFTAPTTGIYVFYAHLMNHAQTSGIHWALEKSGSVICSNTVDGPNSFDKASCLTVARVEEGQQVFVRTAGGGSSVLAGSWWCSFAGFLLYSE